MQKRTFDRYYREDWRSLNYPVTVELDPTKKYRPRSYTWRLETYLDQGQEGACVGFAFSHELIARPQVVTNISNETAHNLYFDAQYIDEWAGGAYPGATPFYEGTSILAGVKVCKNNGYYSKYTWGLTTEETARAVAYFGPAVIGTNWYSGMWQPDQNGYLHPFGDLVGGHAIVISAVKIRYKKFFFNWWARTWDDVDWEKSHFVLHNSWGKDWGDNGTAKISFLYFDKILKEQMDVCFPVRTRKV